MIAIIVDTCESPAPNRKPSLKTRKLASLETSPGSQYPTSTSTLQQVTTCWRVHHLLEGAGRYDAMRQVPTVPSSHRIRSGGTRCFRLTFAEVAARGGT